MCHAVKELACEAECSDYREWRWDGGGEPEALLSYGGFKDNSPCSILPRPGVLTAGAHAKLSSMSGRAELALWLRIRSAKFIPTRKRVICTRFYF